VRREWAKPDPLGKYREIGTVISWAISHVICDEEGEDFLLDKAATPLRSYLEHSKGKRCIVFLVNGQRQESLDNSLIAQDLGFKYLRMLKDAA
jgi:hypothetical protein